MSRPLEISRDEAEMLVDLCENSCDGRLWILAEELRQQWGMGPQLIQWGSNRPVAGSVAYLGLTKT